VGITPACLYSVSSLSQWASGQLIKISLSSDGIIMCSFFSLSPLGERAGVRGPFRSMFSVQRSLFDVLVSGLLRLSCSHAARFAIPWCADFEPLLPFALDASPVGDEVTSLHLLSTLQRRRNERCFRSQVSVVKVIARITFSFDHANGGCIMD